MSLRVPSIGIVIPTFNRAGALLTCLRHLEVQTEKDFEVVIVNDGSTDGTGEALAGYLATAPFPVRVFDQPNSGPAHARNLAIAALAAPICLMIGDDTFPTANFVAVHLAFHRAHPATEAVAVGLTRWSEAGQTVTPLMRWLAAEGVQFAYRELLEGKPASWRHFYTSNLSIKTELVRANPFDEGFPTYGLEDIELGYRLAQAGSLDMHFLRDAIVDHLHPTTFSQTCLRAERVGIAARRFEKLWPERMQWNGAGFKGRLLMFLARQPMLAGITVAAKHLTTIQCPNPLLRRAVQLHQIAGYEGAGERSDG